MSSLFGGLFAGRKYGFLSDDDFASLLSKPGFAGIWLHEVPDIIHGGVNFG